MKYKCEFCDKTLEGLRANSHRMRHQKACLSNPTRELKFKTKDLPRWKPKVNIKVEEEEEEEPPKPVVQVTITSNPPDFLFDKFGNVAVDKNKHPELYNAIERSLDWRKTWQQIVDYKKEGKHAKAEKLRLQSLGLWEPMTDEAKEKLRQYGIDHKEEIDARRKMKQEIKKRTLQQINRPRKRK